MSFEDLVLVSSRGFDHKDLRRLNAYLGVSFSLTEFFTRPRMQEYFMWAETHLNNLVVIIADHLEGYNFQVFKNHSPDEAFERAADIGSQLVKHYTRAIPAGLESRIEIVTASELLKREQCAEALKLTEKVIDQDPEFKADVETAILDLLSGKLEDAGFRGTQLEAALNVLQHYVLEEIAIILYLVHLTRPTYPVAVFPYPPRTVITKIYDQQYGGAFRDITRGEPFSFVQVAPRNIEILKSQKHGRYREALRYREEENVMD